MSLDQIFDGIDDDWVGLLDGNSLDKILEELNASQAVIAPPLKSIFNFARFTPLEDARVVIVGQDPYPTAGHAHGLAFSCLGAIPQSLVQIYKCLEKQKLISRMPTTGNLTQWTRQGVVLLNRAFTTTVGNKKAHTSIWNEYTRNLIAKMISYAAEHGRTLIFILWGAEAKQLSTSISKHANCRILEYAHPSPMGGRSFVDCPNFVDCNKLLAEMKQPTIDWNVEEGLSTKNFDEVVGVNESSSTNYAIAFVTASGEQAGASYAIYFHTKGAIRSKCIYGKTKGSVWQNSRSTYVYGISRAISYVLANPDCKSVEEIILLTDSKECVHKLRDNIPENDRKLNASLWSEIDKSIETSSKIVSAYYSPDFESDLFSKDNFNNYATSQMFRYANAMAQYASTDESMQPGTELEE